MSNTSNVPAQLKYLQSHEWLRDEGDGSVTIGITDHAQALLGDLVFVELPELGNKLQAGRECAVVESVKSASDVYSPVSGEVIAINESLVDAPETVNTDPYGAGWLCRVRLSADNDLAGLLDAASYTTLLAEESH